MVNSRIVRIGCLIGKIYFGDGLSREKGGDRVGVRRRLNWIRWFRIERKVFRNSIIVRATIGIRDVHIVMIFPHLVGMKAIWWLRGSLRVRVRFRRFCDVVGENMDILLRQLSHGKRLADEIQPAVADVPAAVLGFALRVAHSVGQPGVGTARSAEGALRGGLLAAACPSLAVRRRVHAVGVVKSAAADVASLVAESVSDPAVRTARSTLWHIPGHVEQLIAF